MSLKKIVAQIRRNRNFLVTAHVNLEGDAIGAQLAFYWLVKKLGKNAVMVDEDSMPYGYDFLPGIEKIIRYKDNLKNVSFDCFVVLDCSDLKRTGEVWRLNKNNKPVINIDHHISNDHFGTYNWVVPHASSACELVYRLYKTMKVPLDPQSALCLYTGMVCDTGSFRYTNTGWQTHRIASDLLKYGVNPAQVYKNVFGNYPLKDMQLISKIQNNIQANAKGNLIWFEVKKDWLKKYKTIYADLSDQVLSFGRQVKGAEVVALFKENLGLKSEVRVNFRSQGKVDVNEIAKSFGGGGHRTAAGCTIAGRLDDIKKKVLRKIEEKL